MFSWLKKNKVEVQRKTPSAPANTRIYAIGDIHGRFDLLNKLHGLIKEDSATCPENYRKLIIYIGDYVDRGFESRQVIDSFINDEIEGFERIFLKGNHEWSMLNFLSDASLGEAWFAWGGLATIQSYGVSPVGKDGKRIEIGELQKIFSEALPESHLNFLKSLPISHSEGHYFFAHAGIRPGVDIGLQSDIDMMTIRDDFVYSDYPSEEKTVVFGHTIFEEPFAKSGKIAIDTGAYATGKLTAVVLEGTSQKFIST